MECTFKNYLSLTDEKRIIRIQIRMWIRTKILLIYNTALEQHIKNVDYMYCINLTITAVWVHQSCAAKAFLYCPTMN
jgi:hypothetical protein